MFNNKTDRRGSWNSILDELGKTDSNYSEVKHENFYSSIKKGHLCIWSCANWFFLKCCFICYEQKIGERRLSRQSTIQHANRIWKSNCIRLKSALYLWLLPTKCNYFCFGGDFGTRTYMYMKSYKIAIRWIIKQKELNFNWVWNIVESIFIESLKDTSA